MKTIHTICIIGSGNVATQLAINLYQNNYCINGIYSRNENHAKELAAKVGCLLATNEMVKLPQADLFIFSVKDSVLEELLKRFLILHPISDSIIAHTAGSISLSVISEKYNKAAVIYPLQTISKSRIINFNTIPLFIEASDEQTLQVIQQLSLDLSPKVQILDSPSRKILHLSAVFACNFTNHCYHLAFKLLEDSNIDPRYLLPIIDETAQKVHSLHPRDAQTGPAKRWDENVINRQISELADQPNLQEIYTIISKSIYQYSILDNNKTNKSS